MDGLSALIYERSQLRNAIKAKIDESNDMSLVESSNTLPSLPHKALKLHRKLLGHYRRIISVDWARDSTRLVTLGARDGCLLVWDAKSAKVVERPRLRSSSQLCCSFSPSGQFVTCGGLDNMTTLYDLQNKNSIVCELQGHSGYVMCTRFVSEQQLLSSSGDETTFLWDIPNHSPITTFSHPAEPLHSSINPTDSNMFAVSLANNAYSAILYDIRTEKPTHHFFGTTDSNSVDFFPNGLSFATASDDGVCRLFDVRAGREMAAYDRKSGGGANTVSFSKSGRMLFAGYDSEGVVAWDTLKGEIVFELPHPEMVQCVKVSPNGQMLFSGCVDAIGRIWK